MNVGEEVDCPMCFKKHILEWGKNRKGEDVKLLLFYKCGTYWYLWDKSYEGPLFNSA